MFLVVLKNQNIHGTKKVVIQRIIKNQKIKIKYVIEPHH